MVNVSSGNKFGNLNISAGTNTSNVSASTDMTSGNIATNPVLRKGDDGFSPIATVTTTDDGAIISITDKNGTTASNIYNGVDGEDGEDGYSPSASVVKEGNTATITITDKDGTTTAEVYDGAAGVTDVEVNGSSVVTDGVASITMPTDTGDLTNNAGFITDSALVGYATENYVTSQGYITGIDSSDVTTALGYTPYDSSNPNGYTSNTGTVTSVNNVSPVSGNVTLSIPTVNDATITITQGGVTKGTFTTNQGSAATIALDAGSSDVFIAEYNVTTYSDITTAINANKSVILKYPSAANYYLPLIDDGNTINTYVFSGFYTNYGQIKITVTSSNVWNVDIYSLANTTLSNVNSIDAGSAVKTALDNKADINLANVNDNGTIRGAGWAMPSNTYETLTWGATSTVYTAPANGWFYAQERAKGTGLHYVLLQAKAANGGIAMRAANYNPTSTAQFTNFVCLPAKKGDEVYLGYSITSGQTMDINIIRFIYAQGSESEAP